MNKNTEITKIKVNNGQELVAKVKEYKNSGGEWKLLERYIQLPSGGKEPEYLFWGIIISNGSETVDIHLINEGKSLENASEEYDYRNEVINIFPEYKFALFNYGEEGKNTSTCKLIKEKGGEYSLYRYLVAENFDDLKKIIKNYFRENEAKIYNSPNRKFSDWVEIIDGQDGNMYLYVGEKKNENSGREIKIGIKKSNWKEHEKGNYESLLTSKKILETRWNLSLLSTSQPLTPTEKENAYRGLEETFKEQWPIRKRLCRGYWENVIKDMEEGFSYWYEKSRQNQHWDHEANEQGILLKSHIAEIKEELSKNQNIKICSDTCEHGLSKNKPSTPTSPKKGNSGKNENNQINNTEKSEILSYFLAKHIKKISLDNGKLVIEYNNHAKKIIENEDQQLQKYHQYIQTLPNQSLSLSELQENNINNSSNPNQNNTAIYISLAVVSFMVGGIIVYFLVRKKKK